MNFMPRAATSGRLGLLHAPLLIDTSSAIEELRSAGPAIHVVWVGSTPPEPLQRRLANWVALNPSTPVALWNQAGLTILADLSPEQDIARLLAATINHAATSDVARFAILGHLGGIYVDADMEPVRPVSELLSFDHGFLVRESRWLLNAGAIGLPRGSRFAHAALDLMRMQLDEHGSLSNFMCGPPLVTELAKMARRWPDSPHVLPPSTFYPVNPFRFPVSQRGTVPPYAVHLYDHTWGEGTEMSLARRVARALQLVTPRDIAIGNRRATQLNIRRYAREYAA